MNELLEAALAYAEQGLYVFPVKLGVKQSTEGEKKKSVRPDGPWKEWSTIDPDTIREWFTDPPADRVLAIDTGKSGIVAVDLDVADGKDGPGVWSSIGQSSAVRVRTPSGGLHDWFAADPLHPVSVANKGEVGDGIDIRGDGGFVFAPPSRDPRWEGSGWDWVGDGFARERLDTMPAVVWQNLEAAQAGRRNKPATATPAVDAVPAVADDPFVTASQIVSARQDFGVGAGRKSRTAAGELLTRELEKFRALTVPGSGRSHVLAQELAVLAGHGVDVFWTYEGAMAALMDACRDNGFSAEHGVLYAQEQAGRGLNFGMRELWTEVAEPVAAVAEMPTEDAVDALLAEMLGADEIAELAPPKPLVKGLLNLDSESWIIGEPGSKKSFVATDLAGHVALGRDWHGLKVTQGMVIMIVAEGKSGMGPRAKAFAAEHGVKLPGREVFAILPRPVQSADDAAWRVLVEACRRKQPALVVIDTQARVTVGLEENSAKEMGVYISAVSAIREATGACVLTVHHTGRKGGDARGSSAIDGAQTTELKVESVTGKLTGRLSTEKQKDIEPLAPLSLIFVKHTVGVDDEGDPITSLALSGKVDAYVEAAGEETVPDPGQAVTIAEPAAEAWGRVGVKLNAVMQMRALQTLLDVAGPDGITEPRAMAIVAERWHSGQIGRRASNLNKQAWQKAWSTIIELEHDGEQVVVRGSNATRFTVNSLVTGLVKRGEV